MTTIGNLINQYTIPSLITGLILAIIGLLVCIDFTCVVSSSTIGLKPQITSITVYSNLNKRPVIDLLESFIKKKLVYITHNYSASEKPINTILCSPITEKLAKDVAIHLNKNGGNIVSIQPYNNQKSPFNLKEHTITLNYYEQKSNIERINSDNIHKFRCTP